MSSDAIPPSILDLLRFARTHQAMRYRPDRVKDACRTNRSFAIAHNLEHLCPPPPNPPKKRGKKKKELL